MLLCWSQWYSHCEFSPTDLLSFYDRLWWQYEMLPENKKSWGLHVQKEVSLIEKISISGVLHLFPWLLISRHLDLWGVLCSELPSLLGQWRNPHKGSFCAQQKAKWNPSWTAPGEAGFPHHSAAHWANVSEKKVNLSSLKKTKGVLFIRLLYSRINFFFFLPAQTA